MTDLSDALKRMEERTRYVDEHQVRTQAIFEEWANLSCTCDGWDKLKADIKSVIYWLTGNKKQFPNYLAHIASWSLMLGIANERAKARQYILKCPGYPNVCFEAGNCFNLQHMMHTHSFEAAHVEGENLCRVTLTKCDNEKETSV